MPLHPLVIAFTEVSKWLIVQLRSPLKLGMCRTQGLDSSEITFLDYLTLIIGWLEENEL